jgi:hypothetical protein
MDGREHQALYQRFQCLIGQELRCFAKVLDDDEFSRLDRVGERLLGHDLGRLWLSSPPGRISAHATREFLQVR